MRDDSMTMYEKFEEWLNGILDRGLPNNTVGVGFNIYEENNKYWSIQIIATDVFTADDDDWMCEEIFSSEENLFRWQSEEGWTGILKWVIHLVSTYLDSGKYGNMLREYKGIGVGFVDGDIEMVCRR